jgi:glycosyltransferase involved in cell wall biosynthesis
MVVPACPAPFGDTAARWFEVLIRELVRRGHHVDLLCVSGESEQRINESRRALERVPGPGRLEAAFHRLVISRPALLRKLVSARRPFSEIDQADGVRRALDARLARGYDVLHVEQLWSGWVSAGMPRSVLNVHHLEVIDREDDSLLSWSDWKTLWQMRRATAAILQQTANVRFFTSRLSSRAREYNPAACHWVLPFAMDSANYIPVTPAAAPVVGMIGSMHWPPSRGAAERLITSIWPLVRARVPNARLVVAGWNADRHLAHHAGTPGLELRANVATPREFFSDIAVMAYAPRRGSGMKVKVMEAMAFGVPVVTTTEGVEGLEAGSGVHAHVADRDEELASRIVELLRDRAAAREMGAAGRALIAARHNPQVVVDGMVDIYQQVAAS